MLHHREDGPSKVGHNPGFALFYFGVSRQLHKEAIETGLSHAEYSCCRFVKNLNVNGMLNSTSAIDLCPQRGVT